MDGEQQLLFFQQHCHARDCGALFFICRPCYRGQRYCSGPCRERTRRQQRRSANRRHQQSPEGRLDHRDRQRAYRLRKVICRVTDQGSAAELTSGSIAQPDPVAPICKGDVEHRRRVCCRVCGRRGEFIETFRRRE